MIVARVFIITLFILFLGCNAGSPTQSDVNVVKGRIIDQYKTLKVWKSTIADLIATMSSSGTWSNVDYSNGLNAPPTGHLNNLRSMVVGYVSNQTYFKGNATLLAKINLGYNYWISKDYQNKWWWNAIGLPQYQCYICLLMQPYFSTTQMSNCLMYLDRAITDQLTGANLVWTAQIGIVKGVIKNDIQFTKTSSDLVWSTSVYTNTRAEDGIKQDGSFFQHERQEYSLGYGTAFTYDMFQILTWAKATNFAMPSERLQALESHVLDGQQWMTVMPQMIADIAAKGREITVVGHNLEVSALRDWIRASPGGNRSAEWETFIERMNSDTAPPKIGNKAYWISDYMVHSRKGWMSSVKMYSTRTAGAECINDEGKLSLHLSDGANYLYTAGDEYKSIFPLWDWNLIPGTTTDQKQPMPISFLFSPLYSRFSRSTAFFLLSPSFPFPAPSLPSPLL